MRIRAVGGLCNRLQAVLSWRAVHGSIEVVWDADDSVSFGAPQDVFEPIDGVCWVPGRPATAVSPPAPEEWSVHKDVTSGWERAYVDLKPLASIKREIASLQEMMLGPYLSMHIRRTDWTHNMGAHGGHPETDDDFAEWIAVSEDLPVYLATDNGQTRGAWLLTPHDIVTSHARLEGTERQGEGDRHRNGTLADAVVDLFVCAGADGFKGSEGSSFTETIRRLRALR